MESTGADLPRSMHPTLTRDSESRVASKLGLLCWMDVKPEFERSLRCKWVDGGITGCSGVEKRTSGQGMYNASRQVPVGGICGEPDGKGTQLVGERFS